MTEAVRVLVVASAAIGRGDRDAVRSALERAAAVASAVEVEEMLLQSHLFVGYPAMIQALATWRSIAGAVAGAGDGEADGVGDADAGAGGDRAGGERRAVGSGAGADVGTARSSWRERGERVCAVVYGGQYGRLRANVARLHPVLDLWMVADGYGRVLGRPGLALDVRELCIIALLCPQDAPEQLYAHLRGGLNAGAVEADVEEAVALSVRGLSAERVAVATELWREVKARRQRV